MSIWDTVKPAKKNPVAVTVGVTPDQQGVTLSWDDGHISNISARFLRQSCPCAECVEEFTGRVVLDPDKVPADLKVLEVSPVGNYALSFVFADAHRTGIYNWAFLRHLG